jgi:endoglucanase
MISHDEFYTAWSNVLFEYGHYTNLIGIDIKNEPHGNTHWEEWSAFVLQFIKFVEKKFPYYQGLFWVEGIQENSPWGGSFSSLQTLLGINPNLRIVFSPHVYGVSVRGYDSINDGPTQWNTWFGFLKRYFDNLLCIGEIGGINGGLDYTWHQNVLSYLLANRIQNFYYWCLNPDSSDTGGILNYDWTTIDQSKMDFCHQLQPNPTFVTFE